MNISPGEARRTFSPLSPLVRFLIRFGFENLHSCRGCPVPIESACRSLLDFVALPKENGWISSLDEALPS